MENLDKQVRVVVADDHELVRTGLKLILERLSNFETVGEASTGITTIEQVKQLAPDILILDIQMPDLGGIEVLHRLSKTENPPPVLVISAANAEKFASQAFDAGAWGYLRKDASAEELEQALRTITEGKKYINTEISNCLLSNKNNVKGPLSVLSKRETEIFKLLAEGKKNKEVAELFEISVRTVDTHRLNIMKKLGLSTNAELAQLAIKQELL